MTQVTDTDIRDLKDLILGLDKKIDDIKADVRVMDTRLVEVEKKIDKLDGKIDKLDGRLWSFGGTILAAVLAALLTIFGRYIFTGLPNVH
jgi:septal ring factor EnvC (AmiA/AmiB activator)